MGLIDSTNKISRELLTAKQEREQERAERKQVQRLKELERIDKEVAQAEALEELERIFRKYFENHSAEETFLVLSTPQGRELAQQQAKLTAYSGKLFLAYYDRELKKYHNQYQAAEKLQELQALEELKNRKQQNKPYKQAAIVLYKIIIGIFKILLFFLLLVAGFSKFVYDVSEPKKRRYR